MKLHVAALKALVLFAITICTSYLLCYLLDDIRNGWVFVLLPGVLVSILILEVTFAWDLMKPYKHKAACRVSVPFANALFLVGFYLFFSSPIYMPVPFVVAFSSVFCVAVIGGFAYVRR